MCRVFLFLFFEKAPARAMPSQGVIFPFDREVIYLSAGDPRSSSKHRLSEERRRR